METTDTHAHTHSHTHTHTPDYMSWWWCISDNDRLEFEITLFNRKSDVESPNSASVEHWPALCQTSDNCSVFFPVNLNVTGYGNISSCHQPPLVPTMVIWKTDGNRSRPAASTRCSIFFCFSISFHNEELIKHTEVCATWDRKQTNKQTQE